LTANWSTKRTFPAIDIQRSGTRKEELLIRRRPHADLGAAQVLNPLSPVEAMELLIDKLSKTSRMANSGEHEFVCKKCRRERPACVGIVCDSLSS